MPTSRHPTAQVIEAEGRLRSEKPQMHFIFPTDHSVRKAFETVAVYVGVEPVKVAKVKPGEFCIQFFRSIGFKKDDRIRWGEFRSKQNTLQS